MTHYKHNFSNLISELDNTLLRKNIQAAHRFPNDINIVGRIFDALVESHLILLSGDEAKRPTNGPLQIAEDSFGLFEKGTLIPLVLLTSERGDSFLPAFTDMAALRESPFSKDLVAQALPATQVAEMFLCANAKILSINPFSDEGIEINRDSILCFVEELQRMEILPQNPCVELTDSITEII